MVGIIITDLDSSSESEEDTTDPDKSFISISPALLQHISSRSHDLLEPKLTRIPSRGPSQALVLFKPLPIAGIATVSENTDRQPAEKENCPPDGPTVDDGVREDDAMDIEP